MQKKACIAIAAIALGITAILGGIFAPLRTAAAFAYAENENAAIIALEKEQEEQPDKEEQPDTQPNKDFIRWIDINADGSILKSVLKCCRDYRKNGTELDFCEVLAYLATKNGNKFSPKSDEANLKKLRAHLDKGGAVSDIYGDNKYYKYYVESFNAVYGGIVGAFKRGENAETEYGIKGFFPLAGGFWYTHYDDFGSSRTYGYKRRHLGHDFMGSQGTPIIALEGGTVNELGWNRYGGWRIGIRSHDKKRYYYYAHLKKDKPFPADLKQGDTVEAGQVIGFLGQTGYSSKENVNLKSGKPHLHLGLQIIFDESQEKGSGEIWVDLFGITKLLASERAKVEKNPDTGEWESKTLKYPV
ncbi:MAG: M23 family metallopeptidase [Firmicutes bacterium]|nr:M23 family metallopeptidase [Bacillota bacterium]